MAINPKFNADIGADISKFMRNMATVDRKIKEIASGVTIDIKADISGFMQRAATVQRTTEQMHNNSPTIQVDADIGAFTAQAAAVQSTAATIAALEPTVTVDADTTTAEVQILGFMARMRLMTGNLVVRMRARWDNYQAVMGQLASFSRNFSEITGMVGGGLKVAISPAIVPVIASVVGLLGNLGPMLGTIAGSTFALVGSFAAAGFGAAGFAAVAIPSIKKVFTAAEDLKGIEEKLAKATTWEARNKLLKEQAGILNGMSKAQKKAGDALNAFKENYSELVKSMESQVLDVFASALTAVTGVLELARPMIRNATDAVGFLMDAFNRNLEAKDVKDFFTFLAKSAGPALITIGKAAGNFMMGLFNMFRAFLPLSVDTQNGFLAMSESFRKWSDGLSSSKKFQAFIDYVKENMPKIRSIFSDAIQGMINMFGGFSGSSSDMMTSLQDLMERFKKWSATISENKGFQNFLDYFKTNGPVVVSAIGEIVKLITNFGIAAAPIGAWLLDLVLSFASWTNEMLKAHPWLGRLAAGALVVVGSLMAITAPILLVNALFGGMVIAIVKTVAKMIWGAAVFIAKWTLIGVQATFNALRVAAAWTLATGISMVTAVAKMIASAVIFIARWTLMGVQALLHAAKVAAAWALATGVAMVVAVAKMAATAAVFVAKWVWMGVQSLLAAARMAAAWFIALGPIGWVAGAIIALVALVILNWDKVSAWTSKAWSATAKFVADAVAKIAGWIQQKFPALYNVIATYMTSAKTIIVSIWNYIKGTFSNVLSFLKALVKGDFQGMKTAIQNQMELAKSTIQRIWGAVKSYLSTLLGTLVSKFQEMFGKMVSKIREKMAEAVRVLGQKVGEMPGKVIGFVGEMLSAGGQLVTGLINGIKNMGGAAIEAISGVVGGVIGKAKSLLKIKSPSRVFAEMGAYVSEGLANGVSDKAKLAVNNVSRMATAMSGAFNPAFAMADMRASAQLDTSINRADMGVVRKSFAAEVGTVQVEQGDTVLQVNGREFARFTADDMKREMDRNSGQRAVSRRGTN